MGKYDKLKQQLNTATEKTNAGLNRMDRVNQEMRRVADVAHNAESIIDDIDKRFAQATKLNDTDITFLFVATALQCARWILMPSLDLDFKMTPPEQRLTSNQGAQLERKEQKAFLKEHENDEIIESSTGYFGWNEIIGAPVPYDAMEGSEDIAIKGFKDKGVQLYGKNHHVATLGHDPILGWIFGTMNIMTRTATMKDYSTYRVEMYDRSLKDNSLIFFNSNRQCFSSPLVPVALPVMIGSCVQSFMEDDKRLFAAVARQGMHFTSDAFTKMGLPIPMLNANIAQALLEQGWNSVEAEKVLKKLGRNVAVVGAQAGISVLINFIVKSLHFLYFDGDIEDQQSLDLYEVKTRKILSYSNAIASGSNILYVALSKDVKKLDVGGIIVTIYRLISDRKFIRDVKREFLANQWHNIVMGDFEDFDYLGEE